MNKQLQQSQKFYSQVQPVQRPAREGNPVPAVTGAGRCDYKHLSRWSVLSRVLIQMAVLGLALAATTQLLGVADNMTSGRVAFSLRLLRLIEMQVEIDKQSIEDRQSPKGQK